LCPPPSYWQSVSHSDVYMWNKGTPFLLWMGMKWSAT
jgi:hypothetical protein